MLTIGWPQQVWAAGKSTSTPRRRSSRTTAFPVSGNMASFTQVTWRATLTSSASFHARVCGSCRRRSWVRATRARRSSSPPLTAPAARPWTSTLPRAVASTGPATTGRPVRSARAWQRRAFWLPPPTTWTCRTVRPDSVAAVASASAYAAARLSTMERTRRGGVGRRGDVVLGAPRGDAAGHVARRHEARVLDVEDGDRSGDVGGGREQRAEVVATPRPQGLAEQPGAHHVGEEADGAVDAALVGEVGRARRLGEHGRVELEADEAPGPERDVRRVVAGHGYADHRRGGVVRADRDDRQARRADGLADLREQRADGRRRGRPGRRTGRGAGRGRR